MGTGPGQRADDFKPQPSVGAGDDSQPARL
jgi:hypothetical protein